MHPCVYARDGVEYSLAYSALTGIPDMRTNSRKAKLNSRNIGALRPADKPYEVNDTDLKGFLLRVQPPSKRHPEGIMTFYVRYRLTDGKETRYKIGRHGTPGPGKKAVVTATEARDEAIKILGDVARGIDPARKRKEAKAHTLRSFLTEVYEPWVTKERETGAENVARIRFSFNEILDRKLGQITPWLIDKWRAKRKADGRAVATVNKDLAVLKGALNKAVQWDQLAQNPIAGSKMERTDRKKKVRYLVPDEEKALRDALDQREAEIRNGRENANGWRRDRNYIEYPDLNGLKFADHLKPMVLISLNTGVRRGELFALEWRDVDFAGRRLTVRGANAKSGKTRHIPLNEEALATLGAWRAQCEGDGLVFASTKTTGTFDNVNTAWRCVLREAGLCIKKTDSESGKDKVVRYLFRWHDLRHTFASNLVMAGANLYDVKELLGHSTIAMTEIYAHLAPEHLAGTVRLLDEKNAPQERRIRSGCSVS
jgi:integrase